METMQMGECKSPLGPGGGGDIDKNYITQIDVADLTPPSPVCIRDIV